MLLPPPRGGGGEENVEAMLLAQQLFREFILVMVRANRGGIPLGALGDSATLAHEAAAAFYDCDRTKELAKKIRATAAENAAALEARWAAERAAHDPAKEEAERLEKVRREAKIVAAAFKPKPEFPIGDDDDDGEDDGSDGRP